MTRISSCRWKTPAFVALTLFLFFSLPFRTVAFAAEPLIRISSDPYTNLDSNHKTQVEPDTFAFGHTIVAAFQSGRFFDEGASNIGWATSTTGGQTWTSGFLPATTVNATPAGPYSRVNDPSVAYDAKHKVWIISYIGVLKSADNQDVLVSRSSDGGLTWGKPVVVAAAQTFFDKNWTVCDNTASSRFYGHCYTQFDDADNNWFVLMSTSTDGGQTWGPALTTPDHACGLGGQPLVQPNGTVIVPIDNCSENVVLAFRSTDGGQTWSRVVLAAEILAAPNPGRLRSDPLPSAEIDRSGTIYVVWDDCRFEPGCSANDLVLITSRDGIQWSLPKRIPIDALGSGVDHFIPGLVVERTTSDGSAHLGLAYYYYPNINCTTSTCQLHVGFISSTNGGASWSSAVHLAGPMNLTWLPLTNQGFMVGDYISTSLGSAGAVIPVFAVAKAPTGTATCSTLSTGAPGSHCDEAMFTTPLAIVGGTNAVGNEPTYSLSHEPAKIRHTAN